MSSWKKVKSVAKSYSRDSEFVQAQQIMFRVYWWLVRLMGPTPAREWAMKVVDPDPIQDWYTGHEIGDICPTHGKELSCLSTNTKTRLYCVNNISMDHPCCG